MAADIIQNFDHYLQADEAEAPPLPPAGEDLHQKAEALFSEIRRYFIKAGKKFRCEYKKEFFE